MNDLFLEDSEENNDNDGAVEPEEHDLYECEYEHCTTCRQMWMEEAIDKVIHQEDD